MNRIFLLIFFLVLAILPVHGQVYKLEIKEYAKSASFFISRSPQKLAEYLTSQDSLDAQKVLNIYTWMVHNIKYDVKALYKIRSKSYNVKQTLRRRKGICYQYSNLFTTLCLNAGISAKEILGYSRGLSYFEGETFYQADHSWNGVKIDSAWYLVDVTWGSGKVVQKRRWLKELWFKWFNEPYIKDKYKFVRNPNFDFFLVKPEVLIKDHLPVDPSWQLLKFPISVKTFESIHWSGYQNKIDTSYLSFIDSADYVKMLDKYEFLSYNHYLAKTAAAARVYNPRNYKLLSDSYFRNASSPHIGKGDLERMIALNKESINFYYSAISNAKKHRGISKYETQKTIRSLQSRVRLELKNPIDVRVKASKLQLSRIRKNLSGQEKILKEQHNQISSLLHIIDTKEYTHLNPGSYSKKTRPELVEENKRKIEEAIAGMISCKDSSNFLQLHLKELIAKKTSLQSQTASLNNILNNYIQYNSSFFINNLQITALSKSMVQVDSIGKVIDRINSELWNLEDSITSTNSLMQQLHSSIISQGALNHKLLYQNCMFSKGEECDYQTYIFCNKATNHVYQEKLEVQNMLLIMKQNEIRYHEKMRKILKEQTSLLNINLSLIARYDEQRSASINIKKKKSIYEADRTIKKSKKAIESLRSANNDLRKKIRKDKRKAS